MTSPRPGYYQNENRDLRGNAMVGAVVDVFDVGTTTPATIYSTVTRTPMTASPLPAAAGLNRPGIDVAANIAFFAEDEDEDGDPLEYDVRVTYGGESFTYRARPAPAPGSGGGGAVASVDGQTGAVDLSGTYVPIADLTAEAAARLAADTTEASARATADALQIPLTQKGAANGVATLDGTSKIPTAQLPALSITDTFPVANQAAMLALDAQRGDVAVRADDGQSYILAADPSSTLGNWLVLSSAGGVTSVNGQTGVVTGLAETVDLAPLSANTPAALTTLGLAGATGEASDAGHSHPTTGLVALDGSNGLTLSGPVNVAGALGSCFVGKNSIYGNANFRGYASDGVTENTRIGNDSFIRAGGFSDLALSATLSMSGGLASIGAASGLKLTTAGSGITLKAPSGGIERYLALDVAGLLNVPIGTNADSWTTNNVLIATKDVGGTNRSTFSNFGNLSIDVTNQNTADNAVWGGTVPLTVRHDGTGTLSGNLITAKVGATDKFQVSKGGGIGAWGHAVPSSQPATPVTLGDVIAILQGCGLAA